MNEDDENDEPNYSLTKNYIACIDKLSQWKAVNPMFKSDDQKHIIREILTNAKEECGRTAIEVVAWSECGETRNVYYRALEGRLSDEYMLCMFMACLAAAEFFDKYCKACGIYIGDEYEYGRIIRTYIFEKDKHYDVIELNERLIDAGQPPLFNDKAA